jgi:hypothetical protein
MNHVTIENSLSDGISIVSRGGDSKGPVLSNAVFRNVTVTKCGLGVEGKHALWIDSTVMGSVAIEKSTIKEIKNEAKHFAIVNP